jgi:O-antigen/teichoic acid export membrane protein
MISQVADHLVPLVLALRELRHRGHGHFWKSPLQGVIAENPGLFAFIFNANLNVVARNSTLRFDTLIVGGLLGPASAGFYQLAKRVGLLATKISKPVQQTIYPEIARLWARGEIGRFRQVVIGINVLLLAGTMVALVCLWFVGEPIVRLFFGDSFAPATPLVIVQAVAAALFFSGSIFGPALLSMGEHSSLVRVTLMASAVFFVTLIPAVRMADALGASLTHVLFNFILVISCLRLFLRHTREVAQNVKPV